MKALLSILILFFCYSCFAQLPNGSSAPDWTVLDLQGNSHNLYDVLEDGKSVVIDFSATWCGICWNYHKTQALENMYAAYGPAGTDVVRVYWMDADASTNDACVTDSPGCNNSTKGDWTENSTYPYINLTGPELWVKDDYMINNFPTIIGISPNKKQYEIGKVTDMNIWDSWINETFALDYSAELGSDFINLTVTGGSGEISFEWSNGEITEDITNLAPGYYSCTITEGRGHSVETLNYLIGESNISVICPPSPIGGPFCNIEDIPKYETLNDFFEAGGDIIGQYNAASFLITETSNGNTCPINYTRIYSVENLQGEKVSCEHTIVINDTTPPNIDLSFEETILETELESSIFQNILEADPDLTHISDNCGIDLNSLMLEVEESDSLYCETITRTYHVSDPCGNTASFSQILHLELDSEAFASFEFNMDDLSVQFNSFTNMESVENYEWDFGDNTSSNEANPLHEYMQEGKYTICLTVTVSCGSREYCEELEVKKIVGITEFSSERILLYPNPSAENTTINIQTDQKIDHIYQYALDGSSHELQFVETSNGYALHPLSSKNELSFLKVVLADKSIIWKKLISL